MIDGKEIDNRLMISSIELFVALGKPMKKYYIWFNKAFLLNVAVVQNVDFIVKTSRRGSTCREVWMTPLMAKSLCIREGTIVAKKLRFYIENELEFNFKSRKTRTKK